MQQLKKMGSMKSLLGMMPGAGNMKKQLEDFDEDELKHTEAIIQSMTPVERQQPRVLNGSRRQRIARGSGTTVTEVNALVNRFEQAAKMMKTMSRGGTPQIQGMNMAQLGGGNPATKKNKNKKKKGSKSGNLQKEQPKKELYWRENPQRPREAEAPSDFS